VRENRLSTFVAGLVVALPGECRSLTRRRLARGECLRLDERRLLCLAGIGQGSARRAAVRLLEAGAHGLLSWGCAGALSPALGVGALCLPTAILDGAGGSVPVSAPWHERARASLGGHVELHIDPLLSIDRIAASTEYKRALATRFAATAVDMESAAVATVAGEAQVPFLAVRAIADRASTALPGAVLRATNAEGTVDLGTLFRHGVLDPAGWPSLIRLARDFRIAVRTLSVVARQLADDPLLGPTSRV